MVITIKNNENENGFKIVFKDVTPKDADDTIGFPDYHLIGQIIGPDGGVLYESDVEIISGCSYGRAAGHKKLVKKCFNHFVENYVR